MPDATNPPDDDYDVGLYDRLGHNVLGTRGDDRDETNTETAWVREQPGTSGQAEVASGACLQFRVQNAGANRAGLAVLYVLVP